MSDTQNTDTRRCPECFGETIRRSDGTENCTRCSWWAVPETHWTNAAILRAKQEQEKIARRKREILDEIARLDARVSDLTIFLTVAESLKHE